MAKIELGGRAGARLTLFLRHFEVAVVHCLVRIRGLSCERTGVQQLEKSNSHRECTSYVYIEKCEMVQLLRTLAPTLAEPPISLHISLTYTECKIQHSGVVGCLEVLGFITWTWMWAPWNSESSRAFRAALASSGLTKCCTIPGKRVP